MTMQEKILETKEQLADHRAGLDYHVSNVTYYTEKVGKLERRLKRLLAALRREEKAQSKMIWTYRANNDGEIELVEIA